MIIKCDETKEKTVINYLKDEAIYNTFMLADIENYGFDKDYQTVYGDFEGERLTSVYLKFYNNLIVYSKNDIIDMNFLKELCREWKPDVVMGKASTVKQIKSTLENYVYRTKPLYTIENDENLVHIDLNIVKARPGEEDRIHEFLLSMEELKSLYASKEMIAARLRSGDGSHYYLEDEGEIIGHANSSANSKFSVMIGGVATKKEMRGKQLASKLVSKLSKEILEQGKIPCLFCEMDRNHNLFIKLGFKQAGMWATLEKGK